MKLDIYVNYPGTCEAAFRFYERHVGGKITLMSSHADQPNPNIPADWKQKILHARLEIGGAVLMGADIPGAEPMRSAYLTLRTGSAQEAERLYALLGEGGQIFMKMEQTFFANRFAMLRDRFGTSWMLLHESGRTSASPGRTRRTTCSAWCRTTSRRSRSASRAPRCS